MKHLSRFLLTLALLLATPVWADSIFVPPIFTSVTNSLSGNVALTATGTFFDGPSTAQGTAGTWLATGQVVVQDTTVGGGNVICKLWDGTNAGITIPGSTTATTVTSIVYPVSGVITAPAGNIRISCRDLTNTTNANILADFGGLGTNKSSTLTVVRLY